MPASRRSRTGNSQSSAHRHSGQGYLRIVGGRWRGRKLAVPDVEGLRPTGDRMRETLFNWLNAVLPGASCLDLFAGSGALGLEAISRGANSVVLVEKNRRAADSLRHHCQVLEAGNANVIEADARFWLDTTNHAPFDIVFLDPPFSESLLEPVCQQLELGNLLSDNALIYIETPASNAPVVPSRWQQIKQKVAGQVAFLLYRRE